MKVEIYSDVACPWCYIGVTRFERALGEFAGAGEVDVVFRPYQLDPGAPREAVPMLANLEQRFGPNVRGMVSRVVEVARGEGLVMDYDRGLAANTLDAHRLMWLAAHEYDAGVQRRLGERLFVAHFAGGRNINDAAVLATLAAEAGMDQERVREFLASEAGTEEVRREIAHAQALGITAVPTFVFDDRYAVQGAQPASVFKQALEQVAEAAPGDAGQCADGACEP